MLFWILLFLVLFIIISIHSKQKRHDAIRAEIAKIERSRRCPDCAERIRLAAVKCRYCGSELDLITPEELEESEMDYR